MSWLWQSETTLIDCIRMQAVSTEAITAQHSLEALLRGASLQPSRLPPSAILLVRKLQHRAPSSSLSHLNRTQVLEWERSLNADLGRLAAEAGRPALGTASAGAQAVCFANRAEMLACLASDWLRGSLTSHWWWRTLLRRNDAETAIAREWSSSPEFVPLALEYLAQRAQAVQFAQRIGNELATALLVRTGAVFAVCAVATSSAQQSTSNESAYALTAYQKATEQPALRGAPWSSVVPEADAAELEPSKRVFLAQALMLRRAPATARSAAFQRALLDWHLEVAAAGSRTQSQTDGTPPGPMQIRDVTPLQSAEREPHIATDNGAPARMNTTAKGSPAPSVQEASTRDNASVILNGREDRPQRARSDRAGKREHPRRTSLGPVLASAVPADRPDADSPVAAHRLQSDTTGLEVTESTPPATQRAPTMGAAAETRLQSGFAGVFFLINLAQAMGVYTDFSAPQGRNIELDIWDFLALLGRQLVGDELHADGLSLALATLAGRSLEDPPGRSFEPPLDWYLPADWLDAFPEFFEWKEVARDGRVQVEHPAGFLLKDEAIPGSDNTVASLQGWVNWVAAYVRARLVRAMACDDAAELLCRVAGRVEIRPMYLDVYYGLQSYPTEIRLAGLDRDPGWVPAAGRYVAYHFD